MKPKYTVKEYEDAFKYAFNGEKKNRMMWWKMLLKTDGTEHHDKILDLASLSFMKEYHII